MVYCGKPSRACSHCKTRQAKCDKKTECGQCRRAGLKCPGPRDPNLLVFRDQSKEVRCKVAAKSQNYLRQRIIQPTFVEKARNLFFDRFVHGYSRTYDYIPTLSLTNDDGSCLPAAIDAASLAYYSTQISSTYVLNLARENYACALQLVSKALQSQHQVVNDATLASVLILDLFEKLARTPRSSESWTKHMHGAVALVKLRGDSQLQYPLGLRLFLQLNSTILIGCMQHDVQVPTDLINLRSKADRYVDPMDPKWKLSEIVVQFVGLRVAFKNGQLSSQELWDTVRYFDAQLNTISEHVPQEWKYETIKVQSPCKQVYEQHFHVYSNHHITHTWNNIRIIRILLNTLLKDQILSQMNPVETSARVSENVENDTDHLSNRIVSLSNDILASLPQYARLPRHANESFTTLQSGTFDPSSSTARHSLNLPENSTSEPERFKIQPSDFTPFEISRCYSLIFPLYIAGNSEVCQASMFEWVLDMLEYMQHCVGIKEAAIAAGCLRRREKINPWCLYAKIGSYCFSA